MFNVYEFSCFNLLRKTCTAFLFNEAVLMFAKLPCLINLRKKVKCKDISEVHFYIVKSNNLSTIFGMLYKKYNKN
jgi:hypothetical protein